MVIFYGYGTSVVSKPFLKLIYLFFIVTIINSNYAFSMDNIHFDMKELFEKVKHHPDLYRKIPPQIGTSLPVPIIDDAEGKPVIRMAFFHFYMRMTKPTEPREFRISSPRQKTIVSYPELNILETKPASSKTFGVDRDDSKPVGKYISDPAISYETKLKRRDRFFKLYDLIMPLYVGGSTPLDDTNKQAIGEFKELFYIIGHSPLIPYYKSLNPDFFRWLDENGQ